MHIGIAYDLRQQYLDAGFTELETAEFDSAETIDAIADALKELGHDVERVGNVRQMVGRLATGQRWDLVFNICEGLYGFGREAQIPALLDAYQIPYTFADACVMALCLHKGLTKAVIREAGLPTPASVVLHHGDETFAGNLKYPLFVKPVAEGTGKGVAPDSRVDSASQLALQARRLIAEFRQPVLVEEYLPGREFTVGILGTGADAYVMGSLEIKLRTQAEPEVYSYLNKERCEDLVDYRLVRPSDDPEVAEAECLALAAWRALACRDGGRIDVRCDAAGKPQFLEANPLAGLHPTHSDLPMLATALEISYVDLIGRIVASARRGSCSVFSDRRLRVAL